MITRVLIVDDEILVRVALKTLVPWGEHGFEIIGEAENGVEALAILEREECHIILTDIKMPHMNGLDLINYVRVKWPGIKLIILSNHNDFEYVQKALRLGAVDYTLKLAYTPEELLDKCKRVQQTIRNEINKRSKEDQLEFKMKHLERSSREMKLLGLLRNQCSKMEVDNLYKDGLLLPFMMNKCHIILSSVNNYQQVLEENRFQSEQLLIYTVSNIFLEIMKKYPNCQLVDMHNGQLVIITEAYQEVMLAELRDAAETFVKVQVSFGIARNTFISYSFHEGYREAEHALSRRFFHAAQYILFPCLDSEAHQARVSILDSDKWIDLLRLDNRERIMEELIQWNQRLLEKEATGVAWVREQWLQLFHLICMQLFSAPEGKMVIPIYEDRYLADVIRNAETLEEIGVWFQEWLLEAIKLGKYHHPPIYREEVRKVIQIMEEEYSSSIKVADLAKRVGFAENYLSVLFKRETGVKLVDYLTQIRMQKARELLCNPSYKIYEISEMVGYSDANHFSKYFKKVEGFFPLEYRNGMLGKGTKC